MSLTVTDRRTSIAEALFAADDVVQQITDLGYDVASVQASAIDGSVSINLTPAGNGFHPVELTSLLDALGVTRVRDRQHDTITAAEGYLRERRVCVFGRICSGGHQ